MSGSFADAITVVLRQAQARLAGHPAARPHTQLTSRRSPKTRSPDPSTNMPQVTGRRPDTTGPISSLLLKLDTAILEQRTLARERILDHNLLPTKPLAPAQEISTAGAMPITFGYCRLSDHCARKQSVLGLEKRLQILRRILQETHGYTVPRNKDA